jgi:hypothetical protein
MRIATAAQPKHDDVAVLIDAAAHVTSQMLDVHPVRR